MSCKKCGSYSSCGCTKECPSCAAVCASLQVNNAWNVPACSAQAVLSVPGLTTLLIGSYVWNPTYGWFRVTAFDSVNGQVTVINECLAANAAPGTVVPALTEFIFGTPPANTNITYQGVSAGTAYTLTNVSTEVAFGTTQSNIIITNPGTYLISANVVFSGNGLTITDATHILASLKRQNNAPADIVGPSYVLGGYNLTTYSGVLSMITLPPALYTTLNSDDDLNINAYYDGPAPGAGSLQALLASVTAIKLY